MPRALTILLGGAAAVVVVAGVRAVAWLVAPALLALLVVIAISPAHRWLRGRGAPPWLATLTVVVLVYGVLAVVAVTVAVSGMRLASMLPEFARAELVVRAERVISGIDRGQLVGAIGGLLTELASLTTSLVFLLALLLFLGVEVGWAGSRLAEIAADRPRLCEALVEFVRRTRRYVLVTTVFGLVVATLDTVALALLGIPLAVLWGVLSFVTNYIPNIGFLLGVVPPGVLALVQEGPRGALAVLVFYGVLNFVVQSLIQPRFTGDAAGLSTTVTFLALVFWAWVLGPLGALLAVPLTVLVKVVLVDIDPAAGWAAALLRPPRTGDIPTPPVPRTGD
ncbi:AI-2E family transporter [Lentzea flava]|uniref:AI-2E family transporter n=1 Tax=Lentzea flava TaxID=103732 RepID=A0ABQ2UAW8_9PSEU|nr:AI-2E family transporter [Lentzea flava]MCP2196466.1 putative PurR-regulated permease PerM [Lentzea flava]GGU17646.1 AI-2E family transporter [Lentzea flava]